MEMESESIRLARMEERQTAHIESTDRNFADLKDQLGSFITQQGKANEAFWATRNSVIVMEAKRAGATWVIGAFGTLTIATAGLLAWLFEQRDVILNALRGKP